MVAAALLLAIYYVAARALALMRFILIARAAALIEDLVAIP